jgi:hypothetical protein
VNLTIASPVGVSATQPFAVWRKDIDNPAAHFGKFSGWWAKA